MDEHARFGGVVPEVASRAHLEAMVPTIERACREAGIRLADLDAIAVTAGPGLAGALLVGVAAAKALAVSLGVPLYGVNHLASHVAVDIVEHGPLPEPTLAMLVSGGHSALLLVPDVTDDVRSLGSTIDDAAGEAFDKVARVLGLPFPGGPHMDRMAREGSSVAIDFPRGLTSRKDMERHRFDFSFSGLKTAVARWVEARERSGEPVPVADVAAQLPGGGHRRAHPQGGAGLPASTASRTCSSAAVSRPTAGCGRWPRSGATRPGSGCGCPARGCAPTTGRWWPRSAPRWCPGAGRPPSSTCPPTPRCPSPPSAPEHT